jgi:8-oxo-dGTP diphosphatase
VPFCGYQTMRGPVDSVGFFFRCEAEGDLTPNGDDATNHRWVTVSQAEKVLTETPTQVHWLTVGALRLEGDFVAYVTRD